MNLISGYMLINKSIPSTGGPYTVRFYDEDGVLIQTDTNVPQYGRASCTLLDGTFNDDLEYFKGWNPAPDSVTRDMDCYPVYGDYIISHEEIHDSWETICADNGAHYPLGAYKLLVIVVHGTTDVNNPVAVVNTYPNRNFSPSDKFTTKFTASSENDILFSYPFYMVKVAEGEDGSTSTWISTGCAEMPNNFRAYSVKSDTGQGLMIFSEDRRTFVDFSRWPENNFPCVRCGDWGISPIRQFLNGQVMANLPLCLINTIKSVNKYYRGLANPNDTSVVRVQKSSLDRIWIPSVKELHTLYSDTVTSLSTDPNTLSALEEADGIDYSTVYSPVYPLGSRSGHYTLRTNNLHHFEGTFSSMVDTYWINSSSCALESYAGNHRLPVYIPFGFCL